jgi:hypothetical protein
MIYGAKKERSFQGCNGKKDARNKHVSKTSDKAPLVKMFSCHSHENHCIKSVTCATMTKAQNIG